MQFCELFGDLLDYPQPMRLRSMQHAIESVAGEHPEAAGLLTEFRSSIFELPPGKVEEIYTSTFDFRAEASLYVGHHLFGEHFKRSVLMARLKNWYEAKGFSAGAEMPDHISVVLRFLADNQDDPDTQEFITECLIPAVARIIAGLEHTAGPYKTVLQALQLMLQSSQAAAATHGADQ